MRGPADPGAPLRAGDARPTGRRRSSSGCLAGAAVQARSVRPSGSLDQTALFLHSPVSRASAGASAGARDALLDGRGAGGQEGPHRRRRHPQHLRADERARAAEDGGLLGRDGQGGHREAARTRDGIDIVLMDIMMPDMDGYDTMRAIRKMERFRALPIIAVTAKAMKGDREKTLQAGAWDYLAKPVDTDQMLSVLRSWLLPVSRHDRAGRAASTSSSSTTAPRSCWRSSALLSELDQNVVTATSGREALRAASPPGVRGHPARRQHAGHGRLRDGGADPPAEELRAHPDHLRHRVRRRDARRAAATRWARWTTSSRRSSRRC